MSAFADHQVKQSHTKKRPPDCAKQGWHQCMRLEGRSIKDDRKDQPEHRSGVPGKAQHEAREVVVEYAVATVFEKRPQQISFAAPRMQCSGRAKGGNGADNKDIKQH